jgi:hypothetical protein
LASYKINGKGFVIVFIKAENIKCLYKDENNSDAVALENELHKRLNDQRVNKVNSRKEFFYSTIDELEALTLELSPSAEFNRTMLAEEFRQSQSSSANYTSDYRLDEDEEEDE